MAGYHSRVEYESTLQVCSAQSVLLMSLYRLEPTQHFLFSLQILYVGIVEINENFLIAAIGIGEYGGDL